MIDYSSWSQVLKANRSARGNTSLETAVSLTKSLRYDIQALGQRLAELNAQSSAERRKRTREDIKAVMDDIKLLLNRIEDVSSPRIARLTC